MTGLAAAEQINDRYHFEAIYTADVLHNVSGGHRRGAAYLDNLDLMLELELPHDPIGQGRLFFYGLYNNRTEFADRYVSDLQITSNIDAPGAWRLFEAWYEYNSESWSVLAGLYDLNSEFDVNEAGGLFLNSAHGIGSEFGQTGKSGPSIFPVSSLAIRAAFEMSQYAVRLVLLDGVPGNPDNPSSNAINLSGEDGLLAVVEIDMPIASSGRFWAGYWRYFADFESPFEHSFFGDNDGWYVGIQKGIEISGRRASWFIRSGVAEDSLNVLGAYVGAGVVISGFFSQRPRDAVGIAVASGRTGAPFRRWVVNSGGRPESHETAWELTYRISVNDRVAVQPDIQYVQNSGGEESVDDALVAGVRFEIAY